MPAETSSPYAVSPAVALVIFNRPECTARTLAAIRAARPRQLFVIADGARSDRPGEAEKCAATRRVVESGVDWECEVRSDYAPANLGCARRVASGLDWMFSHVSEAVILEDDCVPDPSFFPFSATLLDWYRDAPSVWHIGGANFQLRPGADSYYFSRYNHVWGWATWARAWSQIDWHLAEWSRLRETRWLTELLGNRWAARYWTDAFDAVAAGRVNSWAYRWTYSLWRAEALAITAGTNLVENVGFGRDATHVRRGDRKLRRRAGRMGFPLRRAPSLARDAAADDFTERTIFSGGWSGELRRTLSRWRRDLSLR